MLIVREGTKKGYAEAYEGDSINLNHSKSNSRRGRVGHGIATTLTTNPEQCVVVNKDGLCIRKYTPKECWRLMGFDDNDFNKVELHVAKTHLYKQAGNSIAVPVIENIFVKLFECGVL